MLVFPISIFGVVQSISPDEFKVTSAAVVPPITTISALLIFSPSRPDSPSASSDFALSVPPNMTLMPSMNCIPSRRIFSPPSTESTKGFISSFLSSYTAVISGVLIIVSPFLTSAKPKSGFSTCTVLLPGVRPVGTKTDNISEGLSASLVVTASAPSMNTFTPALKLFPYIAI